MKSSRQSPLFATCDPSVQAEWSFGFSLIPVLTLFGYGIELCQFTGARKVQIRSRHLEWKPELAQLAERPPNIVGSNLIEYECQEAEGTSVRPV